MTIRLKPFDINQVQTSTVRRRRYTLTADQLAGMPVPTAPLQDFYRALPKRGQARALLAAAELVAKTALAEKPMLWVLDGAWMDAGLAPQMVYLVRRGLIGCVAMNGEAAVRDYEMAFQGVTCEDAEAGMQDGLLGLARESGEGITAIINEGVKRGFSIGECLSRGILDRQPKLLTASLMAACAARLAQTTVHLAIGADGWHRYPGADGGLLGKGSIKDAQLLTGYISMLPAGSLIVTTHRDPMLTQVLVNAVALARNLNNELRAINLLQLGEPEPLIEAIPGLEKMQRVAGPLELTVPLLLGAIFTLVE